MADTEGFEEFYTATVGRLLGQLLVYYRNRRL